MEKKLKMWKLRILVIVIIALITFLGIIYKKSNITSKTVFVEKPTIKLLVQKTVEIAETEAERIQKIPEEVQYVTEPYIVECSAYCPTGNRCSDGTWPIEGETLAGRQSWLGKACNLYSVDKDGNIGEKIGTYTFHDTGFGHDPDGDGKGSIQTGTRIDLFMERYSQAINWGIRKVYIEFLD